LHTGRRSVRRAVKVGLADCPAEFFELPTGAHGLGCGKGAEWAAWQAKCLEWFKARGLVKG